MNSHRLIPLGALLVASTTTACRRSAAPAPEAAPVPVVNPAPTPAVPQAEPSPGPREEPGSSDDAAAANAAARAKLAETVYFGFDRYDLDDAARATLDAKIAILRSNPVYQLRVEGHADDRGSDEYNLATAAQDPSCPARKRGSG